MRNALTAQIAATESANVMLDREVQSAKRQREHMAEQHLEELRAARMGRDTIRISIDALLDPREQAMNMHLEMQNMSRRDVRLHSAINISHRDLMRKSDIERDAFVQLIGREIANHAVAQIIRHWRSR
jgi:hypothetical protein